MFLTAFAKVLLVAGSPFWVNLYLISSTKQHLYPSFGSKRGEERGEGERERERVRGTMLLMRMRVGTTRPLYLKHCQWRIVLEQSSSTVCWGLHRMLLVAWHILVVPKLNGL